MSNLKRKSTRENSNHLGKTSSKKKDLIIGSLIATFIALTPYLFTFWKSVPSGTKTWDTFLFEYSTTYYYDMQTMVWTLMAQVVPLGLLIIWFLTNRHWWYHALLVPIAMYAYEIITILNDDLEFVGNNLILYLLPVMSIIIPSIYLIRARMFNKLNDADKSLVELEEEFKVGGKGFFGKLSDYF